MDLKNILLFLAIFLILFGIGYVFFQASLTGSVIETDEYSFTKAICNKTNYCQDYRIVCRGEKTIEITPLTGAAVQFPEDWQDPRTPEESEKFC